ARRPRRRGRRRGLDPATAARRAAPHLARRAHAPPTRARLLPARQRSRAPAPVPRARRSGPCRRTPRRGLSGRARGQPREVSVAMKRLPMTGHAVRRAVALTGAVVLATGAVVTGTVALAVAAPTTPTAQLIGGTEVVSTLSRDLDVRVTNPGAGSGNTSYSNSYICLPHHTSVGPAPLT